jgi:hypothetical protein
VNDFIEDPARCARCGTSLHGDARDTVVTALGAYCRTGDCRPTLAEGRAYEDLARQLATGPIRAGGTA